MSRARYHFLKCWNIGRIHLFIEWCVFQGGFSDEKEELEWNHGTELMLFTFQYHSDSLYSPSSYGIDKIQW